MRDLLAVRRMSVADLRDLQSQRLRETVRHAADRVPYYRDLFRAAGVDASSIRTAEDLRCIPVTTKADLVAAGEKARALDVETRRCTRKSTSGSTGAPLRLLSTPAEDRAHNLIVFRSLLAMGFRPFDRLAVMSALGAHQTRAYQRLGLYRSRNISRFASPEQQLLELQRYRPTFVWGYATVARTLLPFVDDQLGRIVKPRVYINAGEVLDPHLRARLREHLSAELTDLYGSTEVGIVAAGCRAGRRLHVNADVLVLECIGDDGSFAPGELGAAVVTCLGPRAMPMIRYRVGDIFRFLDGPCPCGSPMPAMEAPIGREADGLRLPDGRRLYPGECGAFVGCREVLQYRFTQEAPDRVRVQVVLRDEATPATMAHLRDRVAAYLGESVQAQVEVLKEFPGHAIKFRTFVGDRAAPR